MIDDRDPRMNTEYVRTIPGTATGDEVVMTGVVHDHPASKYRVRSIIDTVEPDVLALELPPLAISLFERYAVDERTPPRSGGEMSTAIQAADHARVVGIDAPTPAFLVRLASTLVHEKASITTVRSLARSITSVSKHAILCRIAALAEAATSVRLPVVPGVDHECDWTDSPRQQADNERDQVRRATSVLNTIGPSTAVSLRDTTREAHMADRLMTLRQDGSVVVIVGMAHLDNVADRVSELDDRSRSDTSYSE